MLLAAGVGVFAAGPLPLPAALADAKVAETLFKSGKQAYTKGDYAGAITYFEKALAEDAALAEACWWRGSAQEKAGDKGAALASYREFLGLLAAKPAPTKEELRLKALAEKSVEALAGGEKEYRKLEDALLANLVQFAKESFVRDPGIARKALAHALALRPDHAEALKLREKFGGPAADAAPAPADKTGAEPPPFKAVKSWKDLIADKSIESTAITYAEKLMTIETKQGLLIRPESPLDLGTSYAFETEFRVMAAYERGWLVGLLFAGEKKEVFLSAQVLSSRVEILRARGPGAQEEAGCFDTPALEMETWHRLGVLVQGPSVDVWFDGNKVLSYRDPDGKDLAGEIGIFQQRCRTERRVFRAGKVE
jgi:tetratricopeptide (TPR) repeat protein